MSADWTWKIGILHSVGSAAWQELGGKIRRITQLQCLAEGLLPVKCPPSIGAEEKDPQFDAAGFVLLSRDPDEGLAGSLDRVWGGLGLLMPTNGKKIPGLRSV